MNRWLAIALVLVTLGGLALRAPNLALRPMHNDEAVNAIKLQGLWEQGSPGYRYDPFEYHGPLLVYASLPAVWLSGARDFAHVTEVTLRAVPVVFGVAMILLVWFLADGLGRAGTLFAALWTALSPAMVFYSRYYIHEMLLVCFTLLLLGAAWRYSRTRRLGWALAGGAALGLMQTTKETYPISWVALAGAVVLTVLWNRIWEPSRLGPGRAGWTRLFSFRNWKHALAGFVLAALIYILFFTSFLTNPGGLLDSWRTYFPWLRRAGGGSPHIQSWHYYQARLLWFRDGQGLAGVLQGLLAGKGLHLGRGPIWTEAAIVLLSAVGFFTALRHRAPRAAVVSHQARGTDLHPCLPGGAHPNLVRFLGFYSALMVFAYSAISYKTPWCLLGFWHATILLAGVGAAVVLHACKAHWARVAWSALLILAAGHLGWQSVHSSHALPDSPRYASPYEYSPTSPDLLELVQRVDALADLHPQGQVMLIKVLTPDGDCWPLPWYFRRFSQVDYEDKFPLAPVMVVSPRFEARAEEAAKTTHTFAGFFSLRSRVSLALYVERGLWNKYMEPRQGSGGP